MSRDQVLVLALAVGCVLVLAVPAALVVRSARQRSLRTSLLLIPAATLLAVTIAVAVDAWVMFLSRHDLAVMLLALAAAAPFAVGLAVWLAHDLAVAARDLADSAQQPGRRWTGHWRAAAGRR